jgi:hypothetical protein
MIYLRIEDSNNNQFQDLPDSIITELLEYNLVSSSLDEDYLVYKIDEGEEDLELDVVNEIISLFVRGGLFYFLIDIKYSP